MYAAIHVVKLVARGTIICAALFIAACASSPKYKFFKTGITLAEFETDRAACQKRVNDELAAEGDFVAPVGGTALSEQMLRKRLRAEELFVACMESAGYQRMPVESDSRK